MHLSEEELLSRLEQAKQKVTIGAHYTHYKGSDMVYKVINIAITEADNELCVIYQAQYGSNLTFARPLNNWLETVKVKNKQLSRFTKI